MSDLHRRSDTPHRVCVLGSFTSACDSTMVPLGVDPRRLAAYLAVHRRPQPRPALAADLWPGVPVVTALRLLTDAVEAVEVPGLLAQTGNRAAIDESFLALAADVEVDLDEAMAVIRTLPDRRDAGPADIGPLSRDILPSWTSSWIVVERERFRQLRLHAVEELSQRLTAVARFDDAITVALLAVRAAPSRESARRALIEAHLAHGNIADAVAQYDEYRELLRSSVGGPVASNLDGILPAYPTWPVVRGFRRPVQRSAVTLPGLRSIRNAPAASGRRLVSGGSVPGAVR